jgi:hypothetical protein
MKTFTKTGGARIDFANATWPFAKISIVENELILKVIWLGTYTFTPEQIYSIEQYTMIPFLGWGIRIQHNVANYPEKIIFWCLGGNPSNVLDRIRNAGFFQTNTNSGIMGS